MLRRTKRRKTGRVKEEEEDEDEDQDWNAEEREKKRISDLVDKLLEDSD